MTLSGICLASSAIRRCFVKMPPGPEFPIIFPSGSSVFRQPLCSDGSLRIGSPPSRLIRAAPTSCHPSRRTPFPSPDSTVSVPACSSLPWFAAPDPRAGVFYRGVPNHCPETETAGSPRFLGSPHARVPCSHDPGGISAPGHSALRYCLPLYPQRRLPQHYAFRGSITRPRCSLCTLRRVGYPSPRNTRFRLLTSFTGRDLYPLGTVERFQVMTSFLLSQALPGARVNASNQG